jgi:hypothetical protein
MPRRATGDGRHPKTFTISVVPGRLAVARKQTFGEV